MGDTLRTIIQSVEKTSDNGIDLINKVDSFYNSAWDKLVLFGTISFAIIGILIPFVIQWYQKKTLKISEELLRKDIENASLKMKADLLSDINDTLEKRMILFEQSINKLNASINAKTFHLQGNSQLKDGHISSALSDYIIASIDYLNSEDTPNLQIVLDIINEDCLPKLSIKEVDDIKTSHDTNLENMLINITEKDNNAIYSRIIREIRSTLNKLPKEIKDKKSEIDTLKIDDLKL